MNLKVEPKTKANNRYFGGLAILCKQSIKPHIKIKKNSNPNYQWVKLEKDFFGFKTDLFICCVNKSKLSIFLRNSGSVVLLICLLTRPPTFQSPILSFLYHFKLEYHLQNYNLSDCNKWILLLNPTSLKRYKNVYISCIYTVHWNQVSSRCTCSYVEHIEIKTNAVNIIHFPVLDLSQNVKIRESKEFRMQTGTHLWYE
jgi:hypothetical protein